MGAEKQPESSQGRLKGIGFTTLIHLNSICPFLSMHVLTISYGLEGNHLPTMPGFRDVLMTTFSVPDWPDWRVQP